MSCALLTAPGLRSVDNVSAPFPPPLHHCALHGSAKKRGSTIKRLRFALGSFSGAGKFSAPATVRGVVGCAGCCVAVL